MQSYPLAEIPPLSDEILEQAASEPVLLTQESQSGYVLMSAQQYQYLIKRLEELEDRVLGKLAESALQSSSMVGSDGFTTELQWLAALDSMSA
jgi:PHD/YefM family antitoxin component YafN of YafNO toxin-antitoxin module